MTGHRGGGAPAPHLWKGGFQSAATTNRIQPGPVAPSPRWRISATPMERRIPIRRHNTNRNTHTNGAGGSESASP